MAPATATPVDQKVRDEIKDKLGVNMCVEAGAGTGKTTSLVDRIVELLATVDDRRRPHRRHHLHREGRRGALSAGPGAPRASHRRRDEARSPRAAHRRRSRALPIPDRDDPRLRRQRPARAAGRGRARSRVHGPQLASKEICSSTSATPPGSTSSCPRGGPRSSAPSTSA